MKKILLPFFLVFPSLSYPQEVCIVPSSKPDFERRINAGGEWISLKLKNDGLPAIAFFDTSSGELRFASAGRNGKWNIRSIAKAEGVDEMESLLLSADEPLVLFTAGDEIRLGRGSSFEQIDSLPGSSAKGIYGVFDGDEILSSYYFLSANKTEWELRIRRGRNHLTVKKGALHPDLRKDFLLRGLSTSIVISGDTLYLLFTDLEAGTLNVALIDPQVKVLKEVSTLVKLVPGTRKFVAQWMKPFQEGNTFGITFYNSDKDVSTFGIVKNIKGQWTSAEYPFKRGGLGIFSFPFLINGSFLAFLFDGGYGGVVLISRMENYYFMKRLESKGFTGMWLSAVNFPPDDFIIAFSSADDVIYIRYLSDY